MKSQDLNIEISEVQDYPSLTFPGNEWKYYSELLLILGLDTNKKNKYKKGVKYRNLSFNAVGKEAKKAYLCMFKKPLNGHFLL